MDGPAAIRLAYEAWNADDLDRAMHLIHPDVEWRTSGVFPGMEPVYHGHEGVRRFQRDLKTPFASFVIEILEMWQEEDRLMTRVRFRAVGLESGAPVELTFFNEFRFQDGQIVSFRSRAQ